MCKYSAKGHCCGCLVQPSPRMQAKTLVVKSCLSGCPGLLSFAVDEYGPISPVPNHDGTACFQWDNTLWSAEGHFRVRQRPCSTPALLCGNSKHGNPANACLSSAHCSYCCCSTAGTSSATSAKPLTRMRADWTSLHRVRGRVTHLANLAARHLRAWPGLRRCRQHQESGHGSC